jgi:hypothetical protein
MSVPGAGTPRIVRAGPSSVKGTRRSFLNPLRRNDLQDPPLSAGDLCQPSGPDGEGQARGQARSARGEPPSMHVKTRLTENRVVRVRLGHSSGGRQRYALHVVGDVVRMTQPRVPFVVVASAQSGARHILIWGGIVLGALFVLYLVCVFIYSLAKVGGILAVLGGIAGLAAAFGLPLLIALAANCSVLTALIIGGIVAFVALIVGAFAAGYGAS